MGKRVGSIKYGHGRDKDDAFVEYAKQRACRDRRRGQVCLLDDPEELDEIIELFGSTEEFETFCVEGDSDFAWLDIYDDRCRAFGGGWY